MDTKYPYWAYHSVTRGLAHHYSPLAPRADCGFAPGYRETYGEREGVDIEPRKMCCRCKRSIASRASRGGAA